MERNRLDGGAGRRWLAAAMVVSQPANLCSVDMCVSPVSEAQMDFMRLLYLQIAVPPFTASLAPKTTPYTHG